MIRKLSCRVVLGVLVLGLGGPIASSAGAQTCEQSMAEAHSLKAKGIIRYVDTVNALREALDAALKARNAECRDTAAEELSRLYVRGGDNRAAIGILRRLMKANAEARNDPELNNLLGIAYYYEEMYEEASQRFQAALKEKPDYKEPLFNLKSINMRLMHLNAARAYQRAKEYEKALKEFQSLLLISQNFVTAHYRLGLLYLEMERNDDALREFRRSIRINPRHLQVHRIYKSMGDVYAAKEERIKAVEAYMKALERKPDYKEARVALEKYKAH